MLIIMMVVPDQGGVITLGSWWLSFYSVKAARPHGHLMVFAGGHMVLVAVAAVMVPRSGCRVDYDFNIVGAHGADGRRGRQACWADVLGGRVTCHNTEMVAQPMRLLIAVVSMLSSPLGERRADLILTILKSMILHGN